MAEQRFWLGSTGPHLFDDGGSYVDDPTIDFIAFRTLTNILLGAAPTEPENAVRLADMEGWLNRVAVADIDDPSTELAGLSGTVAGSLLVVYEVADPDVTTIYSWDASASAADVPFAVAGDGGYWVAAAGRYVNSAIGVMGDIGVGIAVPITNLHLYENNSSTAPALQIEQDGSGDAAIYFNLTGGGNNFCIGIDNSDDDKFKISESNTLASNARIIIDNSGKVGIGEGTPATKLDVNGDLTVGTIAAAVSDLDKFLVSDGGVVKYRTGAEVLSDIDAAAASHLHDGATLQHDGVSSDGGAFPFVTSGVVSFSQNIEVDDTITLGTVDSGHEGLFVVKAPTDSALSGVFFDDGATDGGLWYSHADRKAVITAAGGDRVTVNVSGTTLNTLNALGSAATTFLVPDSGVIKTRTAAQVLSDIGAAADDAVGGDGTAGRVLRQAQLIIQDGTDAATLNCELVSTWNGDSDGPTDNVAKGATTGNYTLDATGHNLIIEAAALSGNVVMAIADIARNASEAFLTCDCAPLTNDISTKWYADFTGVAADLTARVDAGAILLNILYLTDA